MSEIKVSVSITLPGSVMLTQAEAKQLEKTKKGTGYDLTKVVVKDEQKNVEVINVRTRKSRTVKQSLSICKEAYEYMRSVDSCPPNIKQSVWNKMTPTQRLETHLSRLCEYLNGVSYTYKVFDD